MQASLLHCVLLAAVAGGCTGGGQLAIAGQPMTPDLVGTRSGVRVIAGLDDPIFYLGSDYWRNEGGFWYRSTSPSRGWVRVEDAPVEIRTIERPTGHIRHQGEARADVSGDRRAGVTRAELGSS